MQQHLRHPQGIADCRVIRRREQVDQGRDNPGTDDGFPQHLVTHHVVPHELNKASEGFSPSCRGEEKALWTWAVIHAGTAQDINEPRDDIAVDGSRYETWKGFQELVEESAYARELKRIGLRGKVSVRRPLASNITKDTTEQDEKGENRALGSKRSTRGGAGVCMDAQPHTYTLLDTKYHTSQNKTRAHGLCPPTSYTCTHNQLTGVLPERQDAIVGSPNL
jgi:hypothetical protein